MFKSLKGATNHMSRQSKLKNKQQSRNAARGSSHKGSTGASGVPSRQTAPPWVGNGRRVPKAVRERAAKMQEEREAAAREALKHATREAANAT